MHWRAYKKIQWNESKKGRERTIIQQLYYIKYRITNWALEVKNNSYHFQFVVLGSYGAICTIVMRRNRAVPLPFKERRDGNGSAESKQEQVDEFPSIPTLAERWNMVVSLADRCRWLYNIVSTLAQRWNTVVSLDDRRRWLYNIVSTLAQRYTDVINLGYKSAFLVKGERNLKPIVLQSEELYKPWILI